MVVSSVAQALPWWVIAKAWKDASRDLPHGLIQARLAEFSNFHGVVALTVRRAAAALRFAERLTQQHRLDRSETLKAMPITYMEILQRIDRVDPGEVDRLLPALVAGKIAGPELRRLEGQLRRTMRGRVDGDGGLLRMGAESGRRHILGMLALPGSPLQGRQLHVRSLRAFRPLVVDAVVIGVDGLVHGVRVFTAVTGSTHPRNVNYAALLGLSGSRVLDTFYLVFEDLALAAEVVMALQNWEAAGVGVILLNETGSLVVEVEASVGRQLDPELGGLRRSVLESLGIQSLC